MGARTSAMGPRSRLSKIMSQRRIEGTLTEIAVAHEINRQNVVKEILLHVFLMSKFKLFSGQPTVGKAASQYLSGTGGDQAAHCAPGQITANGRRIQDLVIASDELHVAVDNLFGTTDIMDANYNKADSSSEDSGLREAFGRACQTVARSGAFARFNRAEDFYRYIEEAFREYKNSGAMAFRTSIARQRAELSGKSGADLASRQDRIIITETYLKELTTAYPELDLVMGLYPEDIWREYRAISPNK